MAFAVASACLAEFARAVRDSFSSRLMRIPRDADQRSELMSITIPK
jgi:hypothetical protein